jgi:phage tail protein X
MLSNAEIVKQLRTTADESTTYQNKWLSADNWVKLIKAHHTNPALTSRVLNAAIRKDPSTKNAVDLTDGVANQTGIYRNRKQESGRRLCFYYLTAPGSDGNELLWGNGAGISEQEDCRSVALGKDTTALEERKGPQSPIEMRDRSKRKRAIETRIVTEQKGLPPSTPEGQPNLPGVARMPGPQEYHTPKRQCTIDNAAAEDTNGKMNPNPNAELTPFTKILKMGMPRKAAAVVNAQLNGTKAKWTRDAPAPDPASSKLRKSADRIEKLLHVEAGGDEQTAATILSVVLSRRSMKGVRDILQSRLGRSTDSQIVDSVAAFFSHHPASGRRPKETQNAVDAVLVAATFGFSRDSGNALSERLGKRTEAISSCIKWGQEMKSEQISFVPSKTKQRSDCCRLSAIKAVRLFCHSEEGGRDNTDSNTVYKVQDPEDSTIFNDCPPRLWHDIGWDEKYNRFVKSSMYAQFLEANPGKAIKSTVFRESVCICIKDPTAQSCVDLHLSALYHLMQAVRKAMVQRDSVKKSMDKCECERHTKARKCAENEMNYVEQDPPVMWEDFLVRAPRELIRATCCPAREEPTLCCEIGDKPPLMIPWECTHSAEDGTKCKECGVQEKLQILHGCPVLAECDEEVTVMIWGLGERSGTSKSGEQNTQIELKQCRMKLSDVVKKLLEQLELCRVHYNESRWLSLAKLINTRTLQMLRLLIFTDFSASMDLRAGETDNSSVDRHAVLAIYIVLHSKRVVTVEKDGKLVKHTLYDCDVWHFFAESMSKGKKNDHITHNACLDRIVSFYQEKFITDKKAALTGVGVWTDNCAGQYKCKQNFYKIATFEDRHDGVTLEHSFAQKFCFKGPWDGAGKVVKKFIKKQEDALKERFPDGLTCFLRCKDELKIPKNQNDWAKYEAELDPKILDKSTFTTSQRYFGFATDKRDQYEDLKKEHEHIVFTDRNQVPSIPRIEGTQQLHSVAGIPASRNVSADGKVSYKLTVAAMPCHCLVCRGKISDTECKFKHIKKERTLEVSEEVKGTKRKRVDRSPEESELLKQLEERLRKSLSVDKLTCPILRTALRERSIPHNGSKLEMARRLAFFIDQKKANVDAPLILTDYIRDFQDLSESDGEEGNDEDAEDAEGAGDVGL